jgi:hypothetical protein
MMKKFFLAFVVLLLAAAFYATPYFSLWRLKSALENQDTQAVLQHVDFPAFKESLKTNVRQALTASIFKAGDRSGENFLGALVMSVIDVRLDAAITPESTAALVQGFFGFTRYARPVLAQAASGKTEKSDAFSLNPLTDTASVKLAGREIARVSTAYQDFDTFAVVLRQKDTGEELITFLMKRHGILSWRIHGVRIS